MGADEGSAAADKQWIWDRSTGYRPLARFASVAALQGLALHDRDSYQELAAAMTQMGASTREAVREITKRLYNQLLSRHYPYAAPWAYYSGKQRIRDPLTIHADSGTCLDLSLMFAAMCTAAGLRAFVAVLEEGYDIDHALVLVDLASTPPGVGRPGVQGISGLRAPVRPEEASDVLGVRQLAPGDGPAALTADGIAVEVTAACDVPSLGFTRACQLGEARLTDGGYQQVHLVDVLICREKDGEAPLPEYRPAIYPSLPPMPPFTVYDSRRKTEEDLKGVTGTVVMLGDSGTGKSMLAHRVAATVDHGAGWFLDASSEQALTVALAMEDARATGKSAESVDTAELKLLARASLNRLRNAPVPFVVVLDNANDDPAQYKSLPEPAAERGQLLIITTTNENWEDGRREVIRLPALPPPDVAASLDVLDIPVEAIAGRPLFIDASRRFQAATGRWWWAGRSPSASSAAADLWAAAAAELGGGIAPEVARAISWLPPVRLPVAALVSACGTACGTGEVRAAVTRLRQLGLVEEATGEVTMHRLFRSAVRDSALLDEPAELVTRLLRDDQVRNVLEFAADLEAARHMGEVLEASPDLAATLGLYQLGELFERHGTAADSAAWYAKFAHRAGWLAGHEPPEELRLPVANALSGMARAAMRGLSGTTGERMRTLTQAIGWTEEAELLCQDRAGPGYDRGASHAKAMRGVLLRKRASLEPDGSAAGLDFLRQAETALRESYEERRRQSAGEATSLELDRSQYGQAIVEYYRAVFPGGSWPEKTARLRSAAELAGEAVAIRAVTEAAGLRADRDEAAISAFRSERQKLLGERDEV